jgi:hypothetical protein
MVNPLRDSLAVNQTPAINHLGDSGVPSRISSTITAGIAPLNNIQRHASGPVLCRKYPTMVASAYPRVHNTLSVDSKMPRYFLGANSAKRVTPIE